MTQNSVTPASDGRPRRRARLADRLHHRVRGRVARSSACPAGRARPSPRRRPRPQPSGCSPAAAAAARLGQGGTHVQLVVHGRMLHPAHRPRGPRPDPPQPAYRRGALPSAAPRGGRRRGSPAHPSPQRNTMARATTHRHPDRGRRRPGAQRRHQERHLSRHRARLRGPRHPPGLGGPDPPAAGAGARTRATCIPLDRVNTRAIDRTGGTMLHTSRTNARKMRASAAAGPHPAGPPGRP